MVSLSGTVSCSDAGSTWYWPKTGTLRSGPCANALACMHPR